MEKKGAETGTDLRGQEVTFLIRKSLSGRIGWKIMPEDESLNLRINFGCVEQVMQRIRYRQYKYKLKQNKIGFNLNYYGIETSTRSLDHFSFFSDYRQRMFN